MNKKKSASDKVQMPKKSELSRRETKARDIQSATITPARNVGKEKFEKIILDSAGIWADREEAKDGSSRSGTTHNVKKSRHKLWRKQIN